MGKEGLLLMLELQKELLRDELLIYLFCRFLEAQKNFETFGSELKVRVWVKNSMNKEED
jgi:hypothetical protein